MKWKLQPDLEDGEAGRLAVKDLEEREGELWVEEPIWTPGKFPQVNDPKQNDDYDEESYKDVLPLYTAGINYKATSCRGWCDKDIHSHKIEIHGEDINELIDLRTMLLVYLNAQELEAGTVTRSGITKPEPKTKP